MPPRKKLTAAARRAQLIEVGRRAFAEKGYEAVSVEEIAERARGSKPIVYEYFGGKNGRRLGASHQTGWTSLVICCLEKLGKAGARSVNEVFA